MTSDQLARPEGTATSPAVPSGHGSATGRLPLVVYVLAVGTFLMLTTEFVVAGLLPEIAGWGQAAAALSAVAGADDVLQ